MLFFVFHKLISIFTNQRKLYLWCNKLTFKGDLIMKVIVVGSSHGGYEAVEELLISQPDTEIHWYEKGEFLSFLSCGSQLHLDDVVTNVDSIRYMTPETMGARGVHVHMRHEVTKIDPDHHMISVVDLESETETNVAYDKLILSPGATAMILPVPGNDLENVTVMRGRQAVIDLKSKMTDESIQNIAVIGSGYIGVEVAESFAKIGKNVKLIDIIDRPLGVYLDEELTSILADEMTRNGIDLIMGESVVGFTGKEKVEEVQTDKGTYPADLVVMATGIKPNTEWLQETLDLHPNGLIKTNEYMQTSAEDVFAVGDATLIQYNPGEIDMNVALATNARKQGRYAVKNLNDQVIPFGGVQGTSALRVFDYKFASTGINEVIAKKLDRDIASVYLKQDQLMSFMPKERNDQVHFKLVYDPETKVILGGQLLAKSDQTANINVISLAIQTKLTVEQLAYADFFFQPEFVQPWNILNQAGLKAINS